MVTFNLSELFEGVVDAVPDRVAVASPSRRLTFAELDERANRLAHHLAAAGIAAGDHVALHLKNGTEYLEGMLASYKLRAVPVNINYRYVEGELEHLYGYMDVVAVVVHREFVPAVAAISASVPKLRHVVVVDDSSGETIPAGWASYEPALEAASPERDFVGRSSDDVYCACTGGTTGLPKGVMWRHQDIFFVSLGGGDPMKQGSPIDAPSELPERIGDWSMIMLVLPPLMHVSAQWAAFMTLYSGGEVVLLDPGPFDPAAAWRAIEMERVNVVVLVGNAMACPIIDQYAAQPCDASSLFVIISGGAILSPSVKEKMLELLPNVMVQDGFGSTETGTVAGQVSAGGTVKEQFAFTADDTTTVLDENHEPLTPGDGRTGHVARRGRIPLGYYNDPEKTAATFVEKDGVRWVLPGDIASINADGSILLLGRGSVSINTGGEKVFAEEVENALMAHPAVDDVVIVGVPDDRWGQRVVAVAKPTAHATLELDDLQRFARSRLAGYKLPRSLVTVDSVTRTPSGKPDYGWAREIAVERLSRDSVIG